MVCAVAESPKTTLGADSQKPDMSVRRAGLAAMRSVRARGGGFWGDYPQGSFWSDGTQAAEGAGRLFGESPLAKGEVRKMEAWEWPWYVLSRNTHTARSAGCLPPRCLMVLSTQRFCPCPRQSPSTADPAVDPLASSPLRTLHIGPSGAPAGGARLGATHLPLKGMGRGAAPIRAFQPRPGYAS